MNPDETPDPRAGRPVGGARAIRGLVVAALAAALALLGLAAPATAHGGPIVISVGTDGAGGITANLTYSNDGHPVEESADVTVTAVSDAGESVGPVALRSASEGVGWYVSDPGLLVEGHWTLTATMTTPAEATATAEVDVVQPEPPAPDSADSADSADDAGDGADAGSTAAADDATAAVDAGSGSGPATALWVVLAVVVAAAGALAAVLARRRTRTPAGTARR